jgi:pimeloyl-ACP methyl ester carboxylesterase
MVRSFNRPAGLIAMAGLVMACTSGTATSPQAATGSPSEAPTLSSGAAAASTTTSTDLVADLDVGGQTMHLVCVGPAATGRPTVIFESGLGGDAGQWSDVLHAIQGSTRACAYDRAGDGQSPAAALGRTTSDQVADLRALLAAAKIEPPYLLVGFSLGGWNVMVHRDRHPADVVGAILVDVRPPAASKRWLEALPPESPTESEAIRLAREESTTFDTDPSLNPEGLRLDKSAAEALATKGFGNLPLVVLAAANTSAISAGFEPPQGQRMVDIWWELQQELVSRSTEGRLVKVDGTEHEIPIDRPDAVADAIREVIGS